MATSTVEMTTAHFSPAVHVTRRVVRTLIVDDTPAMLRVFASLLATNPRIEVVGTAPDGLAAIAVARAERPDLVLMDVNMPRMDGLKAAMHIKRCLSGTKIILMSADDDPEVALAAMDCGADGFIPKQNWAKYKWHVEHLFFSL